MQAAVSAIHWGNTTLVLGHCAFEEGYVHGRQYYFEDVGEEQEQEGKTEALKTSDLLGLIATRDEQGHYQVDDGLNKSTFCNGVEELLGVLVGYLSGPLHPEAQEERTKRLSECLRIED